MFGVGPVELAVIVVVLVVVFGPKRIPSLARGIAEAIGEFRQVGKEIEKDLDEKE